jgi:hypothetical protein
MYKLHEKSLQQLFHNIYIGGTDLVQVVGQAFGPTFCPSQGTVPFGRHRFPYASPRGSTWPIQPIYIMKK